MRAVLDQAVETVVDLILQIARPTPERLRRRARRKLDRAVRIRARNPQSGRAARLATSAGRLLLDARRMESC